jgi:hypothetical protein
MLLKLYGDLSLRDETAISRFVCSVQTITGTEACLQIGRSFFRIRDLNDGAFEIEFSKPVFERRKYGKWPRRFRTTRNRNDICRFSFTAG